MKCATCLREIDRYNGRSIHGEWHCIECAQKIREPRPTPNARGNGVTMPPLDPNSVAQEYEASLTDAEVRAARLLGNAGLGGLRYNENKPRFSLVSPWAMEGLAAVLTYGERKYTTETQSGAHNWRKGLSWAETIDSLERHLAAFKKGIDFDTEPFNGKPGSGLPHVDMILTNAMFLSEFQKLGRGTDDRWKP